MGRGSTAIPALRENKLQCFGSSIGSNCMRYTILSCTCTELSGTVSFEPVARGGWLPRVTTTTNHSSSVNGFSGFGAAYLRANCLCGRWKSHEHHNTTTSWDKKLNNPRYPKQQFVYGALSRCRTRSTPSTSTLR